MRRHSSLALALALCVWAVHFPSAATTPWVSGFYVGYGAGDYPPSAIDFSSLTHVIVFSVLPKTDGTLDTSLFIDPVAGPATAKDVAARAHAAGKLALLTVGGADTEAAFTAAAGAATRATFVQNLVQTINAWGFDGLDIDWEPLPASDYPAVLSLISDLRAARPGILITADIGWLNTNFALAAADASFYVQLAGAVDQMNIMSYGMADNWGGWKSWHSSALYGQGADHPSSVSGSVSAFLNAGVPAAKLGIGIGAYGSCWSAPVTAPLQTPGVSQVVADDNTMSVAAIENLFYSAAAYRYDAAAAAPYLTFATPHGSEGCTFVSYEDATSIAAKASYVRQMKLGGTIVWQLNEAYNPSDADSSRFLHTVGSAFLSASGLTDTRRASDVDGDGKADLTVYSTTAAAWYSLNSSAGYTTATNTNFGGAGYAPVPGDFDGDGKADRALYQAATGYWYVLLSGSGFTTSLVKNVGGTAWTPVPGDYDADGKTDFVVYNATTGQWFGLLSGGNYATTVNVFWGGAGYTATPGDFDGDGKGDLALYRVSSGTWYVLLSASGYTTTISRALGGAGMVPVPADFDGDGRVDFAVYNTSTGLWTALESSTSYATTLSIAWGGSGYTPVKGDFDGDGRADLAVYRIATGDWHVLLSGAAYTTAVTKNWGGTGYAAVPAFP